jgi:hypothetical protein
MGMFGILRSWLLHDYEQHKLRADREVVARFSRGNTRVQLQEYIDDKQFKELSRQGDDAVSRLLAVSGV